MAAVEQNLQYKRELHAGDVITVRSVVLEVKEKSIRFTHAMTNDETGEIAAVLLLLSPSIWISKREGHGPCPLISMSGPFSCVTRVFPVK